MEINYPTQVINARMNLDDALKTYSDKVQFITLRDGTNIEIVSNNQNFRRRPEGSYTDNQLMNYQQENVDEFVEENVFDNIQNFNNMQMPQNNPVQLRGRGQKKGMKKSLRKTILKSINGNENEKQFENGKLKNLRADKPNLNLNDIIQFSENNEFLQCANCHKFFASDEKEEDKNKENNKTTVNDQKIQPQPQPQPQQFPQNQQPKFPSPQQFQPFPQPGHHQQKTNQHQFKPNQHHQKPNQNQYYNMPFMNMNMGFNQMQQFVPQMQHNQKKHHHHQIPHQKQQQNFGFNQNQFMPGRMPMINQQMNQFIGGGFNQAFRAKKKEVTDEMGNEDFDEYDEYNNLNNYNTENIYMYPASAKKYNSNKKMYPMAKKVEQISNRGLTRNLSYGFKKESNQQFGYPNMNVIEYDNANEIEYSEYPSNYYQKNMISNAGRIKKNNNHSVVNVKVTRNGPYQYQEYEEYQDYVDYGM